MNQGVELWKRRYLVCICVSVYLWICVSVYLWICVLVYLWICAFSVSAWWDRLKGWRDLQLLSQDNQFRSGKGTAAVMPEDTGGMPELEVSSAGVSG